MTESEWLASNDPQAMLTLLRNAGVTDRKMRLFACACCRRIWDQFPDQSNRDLVVAVEDYPDATFDHPVIHKAAVASSACETECRDVPAYWVAKNLGRGFYKMSPGMSAAVVAIQAAHRAERPVMVGDADPQRPPLLGREAAAQADLLRCIFDNPFSPAQFEASWRSEAVLLLAREAYQSRDFSAMPILADALEESGCQDESILSHCRGGGPHARGCHVVDLVLRRE